MNKTFPIPEVREVVSRDRLFLKLDRNTETNTVFITGQAAQGKSTLAASYLARSSETTLWFHLTRKESDASCFFHLVFHPVRRILDPSGGLDNIGTVSSPLSTTEEPGRYSEALIDLFAAGETKVNIVLDDLDALDRDSDTMQVIRDLAGSLTPNIRLFLISRGMSEMEVHGLKLENKMICIDNEDLAFTLEETELFFQKKGRNWLSREHIENIHTVTEGWVGGIVLVSETIRQKSDLSWLSELIRGDLVEYFSKEVYPQLEKEIKDFLMKISVFEEVDPRTAESFTQNPSAGKILETLERRNLFIHRVMEEKSGVTFRMNRLFRDFLQRELETRQSGEQIESLLHEAGETLIRFDEAEKSIPFFIRAGSWEAAGDSITRIGTDFLIKGRVRELAEWIEAMPEMVVWKDPWLIFYLTMTRRIKGGSRNVEDFRIALDLFREREDIRGILLCTAYIIEAVVFLKESPDRINTWIEQGKSVLESVNRRPTFTWARAVLWQQIGFGYIAGNGDVPKGISACRNAFILGSKIRNAEIQLNASIVIILGHVYTGNFHEAEERLEEMKNLAHDGMHPEYRTLKNLVRIDLALKKGEFETAEYYLDMSQNDIEKFGMIFLYPGFIEARTLQRVYTGRIREALELADHLSDFSVLSGNSFYQGNAHRLMALAFYHSRNMEKAAAEAGRAVEIFDFNRNRDLHYYTAKLLRGLVFLHSRKIDLAEQVLENAYSGFKTMKLDLFITETAAAMGLLYREKGEMERAESFFLQAASEIRTEGYTRFVVMSPDDFITTMVLAAGCDMQEDLRRHLINTLTSRADAVKVRRCIRTLMAETGSNQLESVYRLLMPKVRIRTFGEFKVLIGSRELDGSRWEGNKPRLLLKSLLRHHGHEVPKDMIVEDIWPGSSVKAGEKNFKINLHRLRKALEGDLGENPGFSYIHLESGIVSMDPELVTVDMNEFVHFAGKGHECCSREMPEEALYWYEKACGLYRGDFLEEEPYTEWLEQQRISLRDEYIYMLTKKAEIYEDLDRIPPAIRDLKKVIEINPLQESAYRNLMILYADSGETNAALQVFDQCRHTIREELDVEPDPRTVRLYREIRSRHG
ncbi:MAG: hypothetical protein K9J83_01640 [Desulfarculaceae bacterium]|nr:hypothetical protein [Desulfarculaceae bacterium]